MMREITIGQVDDIPEGTSKIVTIERNKEVAVFNQEGEFFAVSNVCPHQGGPLGEGFISNDRISCPLHGWEFDLMTGQSTVSPNITVPVYDIEVRGEDIILIVKEGSATEDKNI